MFDLPPPDPAFEIVIASRGMSKGIAQTDGPQVVPKAFVQVGTIQFGGQWKNVTSTVAEGEGAAFVNWQPKLGTVQLGLGVTYKFQTAVTEPTDDKALELNGSASRKWGRFGARVSAVFSADDFGSSKQSLYVEAGPSFDITKSVRLSANAGRRERQGSPDYTSFNAGVTKNLGKLSLEARYFDTAQSQLGKPYRGRLVLSGRLAL